MSGITSNTGVFSGINSAQLIDQLLQLEAAPKKQYQTRIKQIGVQQAAYLDLNSKLNSLKTAAQKFNTSKIFQAMTASSSDSDKITASVTSGASAGTYQFVVDRLVSTQQTLSRGFSDSNNSAVGISSLTIESDQAKLLKDTPLSQLNGGNGISRGNIVVTDSSGASATIDLSRAGTINEVLTAINSNTSIRVRASVGKDGFILRDTAGGGGSLAVANATNSTTATSLGLVGTAVAGVLTGSRIATVGGATSLNSLNDGRGVYISRTGGTSNPDFRITTRSGAFYDIDIGEVYANVVPPNSPPGTAAVLTKVKSPVTDLQGVIDRINTQAKNGNTQAVRAQFNADNTGIELVDLTTPSGPGAALTVAEVNSGTTASDLGILGTTTSSTITGRRLQGGASSVLVRSLNGGRGLTGTLDIQTRDGTSYSLSVNNDATLEDLFAQINTETGGAVTASVNAKGTGITLTDGSTGTGPLIVGGISASQLGLTARSTTSWSSDNVQVGYVGANTRLTNLPGGKKLGTGQLELIDSYGQRKLVNINGDAQTIGDVISAINSASPDTIASINQRGDGIIVQEKTRTSGSGAQKISIRDLSGTVARDLNLSGTSSALGTSNALDGSFEKKVTFDTGDTLQQVADKINNAQTGAVATIVNDGNPSRPYRLVLTARASGSAGSFLVDSGNFDLGLTQTSAGTDSRIFYGSSDPSRALLLTSTTNTVTGIANNLSITAKVASATPVTVTVQQDPATIQTAVQSFVDAFNTLTNRIDTLTKYDADTQTKGTLLGDSVAQQIRQTVYSILQGNPTGVTGRYQTLSAVGLTLDTDGNLTLNSDKLTTALQTDAQAVTDLFAAKGAVTTTSTQSPVLGRNGNPIGPGIFVNSTSSTSTITQQGVAERLADAIDRFIKPIDGVLTRANKTLDDQTKAQNARITSLDDKIARKREILQRQFLTMEETIGKLQSSQSSLGNIRSIG